MTKLLSPAIFPTLSTDCPVQAIFVNPPVGGVYGYFCEPSFAKLKRRGCTCPIPRKVQEEEKEDSKNKEKKKEKSPTVDKRPQPVLVPQPIPAPARSAGEAILKFVKQVIVTGLNVEVAVRKFLTENPDTLRNLEIAVAAIIAGAIVSDILSGGTAIAKDPAVAAIVAAMVTIGGELRPALQ